MVKQPLFGQDSSPHITSLLLSSIITLICWIIFCVLCFVIKFQPKTPQYKEVQIVLNQDYTPVQEQNAEVPEPVEGPETAASEVFENVEVVEEQPASVVEAPEIPKPVEKPVVKEKQEAPKEEASPAKPQTKQKPNETLENKRVPDFQPSGIDMSEGVDFGTRTNNATWDETKFSNGQTSYTSEAEQPKPVKSNSGFSKDSAVNAADDKSIGAKSDDLKKDKDVSPVLYGDKIDQIREAFIAKGTGQNGIETSLSSESDAADSKNLRMQDGTSRRIIKSAPIEFSKKAADTIDFDSMTVRISFRVLTDGNVLPSSIKIDKEIFLESIVVEEIKNQIITWLLAPADSEAVAIFDLTIKKTLIR